MLSEKDGQQDLLDAIRDRFRAGEGVACRFFRMNNTSLFVGDHKYWVMTHWDELKPGVNYVINRARLYRDRRDFVIDDTGHEAAVVLVGDDKTELGNRWYPPHVQQAQDRLDQWCRQHLDYRPIVRRGGL